MQPFLALIFLSLLPTIFAVSCPYDTPLSENIVIGKNTYTVFPGVDTDDFCTMAKGDRWWSGNEVVPMLEIHHPPEEKAIVLVEITLCAINYFFLLTSDVADER